MRLALNTRFSDVIEELNGLLELCVYQDGDSFPMRKIKRECERVRDIEAAQGWGLLSCYYSLAGDFGEVERCFSASRRLEKIPVVLENYHSHLSNYGYFSRAHEFFVVEGKPTTGMFSRLALQGFNAGSISTLVAYDELARTLNMDIPESLRARAKEASVILRRANISDEQIVRQLDAVGTVLRNHRIFFEGDAQINSTDMDGVFSGVTYVFRVKRTPEEVFELNVELALCEEELGVQKNIAFDVMFSPS
jgi:hypothetical protein